MNTSKMSTLLDLQAVKQAYNDSLASCERYIYVCAGAGCISSDCGLVMQEALRTVESLGLQGKVKVMETGCMGTCAVGPVMLVMPDEIFYTDLTPAKTQEILKSHLIDNHVLEQCTFYDISLEKHVPDINNINFFKHQVKIALRNCGWMEHASLDAYIARDGYAAAAKVLEKNDPQSVIDELKHSGIGGRGGAGFPTGVKWQAGKDAQGSKKYIVCNADEGDPGAFMDRSIIEGDPHTVIEGMLIGGFAIGANTGYVYIRAEYPLATERLKRAIEQAREAGLLGENIFGSGFSFDIHIRIGAGAFVCGEETALLASIEGLRGEPSQKPPFPFEKGLSGCPTIINNVETLANVPAILFNGADWYRQYGTETSKGTKVFALAGDIANTGIIEVPIGTSLGNILYSIGGGMKDRKAFKAAQIGGPSGGCITKAHLNTATDYAELKKLGAIMGSGGLITMNEDSCMVDTARFFMEFVQEESCGKCTACRLGTKRMLEILERITQGKGQQGDIELLEELGETIKATAMCGLGQTAPNPVLSALRYFRSEFEEHIHEKYCSAGVCGDLFISPCENACPANINVPGYTALIAQGQFEKAYQLIRLENPFPAVCGRVCARPCEDKCRRGNVDEPVAICDLKRFVSDYVYKNKLDQRQSVIVAPRNGKKVAIIGAGPSGLTCGYYLARLGYEVNVYESNPKAGGMLAYGIPEYRLPSKVLKHEIELIEQVGVNIFLNTAVGEDVQFDDLMEDNDAVYIATGSQLAQPLGLPGENLPGVLSGIHFLRRVCSGEIGTIGRRVVVIGGGNSAIDSARTALRLGAESVTILYRRTIESMPAYHGEIHEAMAEGIKIIELTAPVKIIADETGNASKIICQIMELGDFDASGRRVSVPVAGSEFTIEADLVIPAVSQKLKLPYEKSDKIELTDHYSFKVNKITMMTTQPGVFAGGDATRGPDTAVQAIADGKRAASGIDMFLGGTGILNKGEPVDIQVIFDEDEVEELERYPLDMLDISKRSGFDEVVLGYHKLTAMAESMRCLHCERR